MQNPLQRIRNVLEERTLRTNKARKEKILREDRTICPPDLVDLEGVKLSSFMMKQVWSVSGIPSTKVKREFLIPEAEEARKFVGHVLHEEGSPEDPHLLSLPIILSVDKEILVDMTEAPLKLLGANPEEFIRKTWALVTLDMGWALPTRGGRIDRPPLPWKYLLHWDDYERIINRNSLAFWLALGYNLNDKKTYHLFSKPIK
jgi:hypothetical protein